MIVRAQGGERIVLTKHAIQRYRSRVDRKASTADIARAIGAVRVRRAQPSWAWVKWASTGRHHAWLVAPGWALVLRLPDEGDANRSEIEFVAMTCVAKPRRGKAELRQLREQAAEDRWVA